MRRNTDNKAVIWLFPKFYPGWQGMQQIEDFLLELQMRSAVITMIDNSFKQGDYDLKWKQYLQHWQKQRNAFFSIRDALEWELWLEYYSQKPRFSSQELCTWIHAYPCTCSEKSWNLNWGGGGGRVPEAKHLFKHDRYPFPCGCLEWRIEAELRYVKNDSIRTEPCLLFPMVRLKYRTFISSSFW